MVLPALAGVFGLLTGARVTLAVLLALSQAVAVVVEGVLFYDGGGPSFWPVGLMFVGVPASGCLGMWLLGRAIRTVSRAGR